MSDIKKIINGAWENKEIDLTEYYDLIYEYKNDCLIAGIKYNKTFGHK